MSWSSCSSDSKLHGSQNVTNSGCNKNQENLNHTQKDVLPKSLVLHWANLTQQLYDFNCEHPTPENRT